MHWLASTLAADCQVRGLNAEAFPVRAETEPGQTYDHQWIVEAVQRANAWLKQQGGGVMVHLHTDSGAQSHTFGIFAGRVWPESARLAAALCEAAHRTLATERSAVIEKLGDIDYNTYIFATKAAYTPCLIELFSHQNERDIRTFYAHADRLAAALADALLAYLTPATAPDDELTALRHRNAELEATVARQQTALRTCRDALTAAGF